MKAIRCNLSRDLSNLEIHTFADLHIGDKGCDMALIRERIANVKDTPNAYCILNGDLMNMATKTSISDCYAEQIPPMEQIKQCVDLFGPIRDKILCITSGNHERRVYKNEGIDLSEIMAAQLGLSDRYGKGSCLLFIRFGALSDGHKESKGSGNVRSVCYTVYVLHGSGGGRKEGSKAIRLADMASIIDADIYIHSHTHLPMVMKQSYFRVDARNSFVAPVTKLFVNTSAALDYGGYAEEGEFRPNSKDTPVIYLSGERKRFAARL